MTTSRPPWPSTCPALTARTPSGRRRGSFAGLRKSDRRPRGSSAGSCTAARTPSRAIAPVWGSCSWGDVTEAPRLEAASARALALDSHRFRTVRNILAAGQDRLPLEPRAETNPTPMHANIRGADYYAAAATSEEDRC